MARMTDTERGELIESIYMSASNQDAIAEGSDCSWSTRALGELTDQTLADIQGAVAEFDLVQSPNRITLSGNFRPEWKQLVDAVSGDDDDGVHEANVADAARELVECVLYVTKGKG